MLKTTPSEGNHAGYAPISSKPTTNVMDALTKGGTLSYDKQQMKPATLSRTLSPFGRLTTIGLRQVSNTESTTDSGSVKRESSYDPRLLLFPLIPAVAIFASLVFGNAAPMSADWKRIFEQIAGGALLATYMNGFWKPEVLEEEEEEGGQNGSTNSATTRIQKLLPYIVAAFGIVFGIFLQQFIDTMNAEDAWIGQKALVPKSTNATCEINRHAAETWESFAPFWVGFATDGIVLAFDKNQEIGWRKIMLAFIFSFDNIVDGFGLGPQAALIDNAYGWVVGVISFASVLGGFFVTLVYKNTFLEWGDKRTSSLIRYIDIFLQCAIYISILYGAFDLLQSGLTVASGIGIFIVYFLDKWSDILTIEDKTKG